MEPTKNLDVDGSPFHVELRLAKPAFVLGEPVFLDFVVHNRGRRRLFTLQGGDTMNRFGRHDRFHVTVLDANGASSTDPLAGANDARGGNSMSGVFPIPPRDEWRGEILLQDFAKLESAGRYAVVFRHDLPISASDKPSLVTVPVELGVTFELHPADRAALGVVIEQYGQAMAIGDDLAPGARRALLGLTRIDDVRVVPHLVAAATTGTYSQKYMALEPLAAFDDARALRAMVQELSDADENIWLAAANALSKSGDPRALEALWDARTSKSEGVRMTLVHALGARQDRTSTTRLAAMANDPSAPVGNEAKRYLGNRGR